MYLIVYNASTFYSQLAFRLQILYISVTKRKSMLQHSKLNHLFWSVTAV